MPRIHAARILSVLLTALAGCTEPIELLWRFDLGAASGSNPLVTASYVAAGSETGLTVVGLDGKRRCVFDAHGEVISAPKTDGKLLFFGSTNYVFYAIRPDCTEAWKFPTKDRIKSDPLVANGRVYVSSYDGHLYALEAKDGARVWVFPESAAASPAAPVPENEAPAPPPRGRPRRRGAKPEPPPELAAAPAPAPGPVLPADVGDFSYSSPVLHEGVVYVGNLDGRIYAIDAATGKLRWFFETGGPVTSSPRIGAGAVYFGSNDRNVYAVDAASGRLRWKMTTNDWVNSSPLIADGVVYVGSNDRRLYALDAQNGGPLWSFTTEGPAVASPALFRNLVFAAGGSGDGALYALQAKDGALFWKYQTGGKVQADPVIVGDLLYVTSADRYLYCFRIRQTTVEPS